MAPRGKEGGTPLNCRFGVLALKQFRRGGLTVFVLFQGRILSCIAQHSCRNIRKSNSGDWGKTRGRKESASQMIKQRWKKFKLAKV